MEFKWIEKYSKSLERVESIAKKKGLLTGVFSSISAGIFYLIFAIGMYYGVYLFISDCQTFNTRTLILSIFGFAFGAIDMSRSFTYFRDLSDAKRAAKRVFQIVDTNSPIDVFDSTPKNKLTDFSGKIEFDNVCFSYPQRPDNVVLSKFSLTFPSGKTVAIVGPRYKLLKLIN